MFIYNEFARAISNAMESMMFATLITLGCASVIVILVMIVFRRTAR